MVDNHITGCNWIELLPKSYKVRTAHTYLNPQSRCQIEVDVAYNRIVSHDPEGEWSKVAPFRILSFDIECSSRKGKSLKHTI